MKQVKFPGFIVYCDCHKMIALEAFFLAMISKKGLAAATLRSQSDKSEQYITLCPPPPPGSPPKFLRALPYLCPIHRIDHQVVAVFVKI